MHQSTFESRATSAWVAVSIPPSASAPLRLPLALECTGASAGIERRALAGPALSLSDSAQSAHSAPSQMHCMTTQREGECGQVKLTSCVLDSAVNIVDRESLATFQLHPSAAVLKQRPSVAALRQFPSAAAQSTVSCSSKPRGLRGRNSRRAACRGETEG